MPTIRRPLNPPRQARGLTLLEVLISVLILGIGMLGIAAMQAMALRNSQSSLERTNAVVQSYAILDAMRANADQARIGGYNLAIGSTPSASGIVQTELSAWLTSLRNNLGPTAVGGIQCANSVCTVTVRWNDERATGGNSAQVITTVSRL